MLNHDCCFKPEVCYFQCYLVHYFFSSPISQVNHQPAKPSSKTSSANVNFRNLWSCHIRPNMNCGDIPWNLGLYYIGIYRVATSNKSVPVAPLKPIRPLLCRAIFHSHAAASRLKGRTWAGNAEQKQNSPFIMINIWLLYRYYASTLMIIVVITLIDHLLWETKRNKTWLLYGDYPRNSSEDGLDSDIPLDITGIIDVFHPTLSLSANWVYPFLGEMFSVVVFRPWT